MFVSCVRASGRGEAVWACERGVFVNAGVSILTFPPPAAVVAFAFLSLCSWVSRLFGTDCCYAHGLFDVFLFLMVCSWVF